MLRAEERSSTRGNVNKLIRDMETKRTERHCFPIYPEVGAAALRSNTERYYRLWTLLRNLPKSQRGWFKVSEVLEHAAALSRPLSREDQNSGYKGLAKPTIKVMLRTPNPFWTYCPSKKHHSRHAIKFHGLAEVCRRLEIEPTREPMFAEARDLRNLKRFRGAIHKAHFRPEDWSIPISRRKMMDWYGRSETAIRGWEKQGSSMYRQQNITIAKEAVPGEETPDGCFLGKIDNKLYVLHRLPNSYQCTLVQKNGRSIRRAKRQLGTTLPKRKTSQARPFSRLTPDQFRQIENTFHTLSEGEERLCRSHEKADCGAVRWIRFRVVDDALQEA